MMSGIKKTIGFCTFLFVLTARKTGADVQDVKKNVLLIIGEDGPTWNMNNLLVYVNN